MKRNFLFFVNPVSGVRSKVLLRERIGTCCRENQASFQILSTNKEGDYFFLPEKIRAEQITDVVICGGDGSIRPVVSHLLKVKVNVGIIPLGSGNGLARTAGISGNVVKALDNLFTGIPKPVDAFTINGQLGCQIAGFGFDAYIATLFSLERKRGVATYTKLAINNFFRAKPYRFEIKPDEEECFGLSAFILCVSNANQFGNNLRIAPKASLSDGLLDVIILKKTSKAGILAAFVNHLLFAKKTEPVDPDLKKEKVLYFNSQKITIRNTDLAPVHIDGDPAVPQREYEIAILPSAYSLICPPEKKSKHS